MATGMATELGHIAGMLKRLQPEATPLQRRLSELGKLLIIVCLGLVAVIFALQLLRGGQFLDVLLVSISLAVAAVPEGLPAVVTMTLALGLQRMVKRNAIVRKLPSVETLGSATVICSDKTGTLTRNEMTVCEIVTDGARYRVTGTGYSPRGQFLKSSPSSIRSEVHAIDRQSREANANYLPVDLGSEADLIQALTIGGRCNNSTLSPSGDRDDSWKVIGDPTEGARSRGRHEGQNRCQRAQTSSAI